MGLFDLLTNTVEGVTQTAIGTVKIVASPITGLVKEDAAEDAMENIEDGVEKIGKSE